MESKIETIRNRIGDQPKTEIEQYIGNGTNKGFDIHNKNPYNFEITVAGVPNTAFTFDADISKVLFDTAPANEAVVAIKYKYAAYTDAELTALIEASDGDVDHATAEALRQTLGSQARMVSFQHGDRSVSMSDIFKNLSTLLDKYEKKISNSGSNGSSFAIGKRVLEKDKGYRPDDLSRLFM